MVLDSRLCGNDRLSVVLLNARSTSESAEQTNHNIDILIGAVNALIERDNQRALEIQQLRQEFKVFRRESEAYRRENDQRFNTLLEEIRFLIRRLGNEPIS